MRVLLFGASGTLGLPQVDALVEAGHEVTGTSRGPSGAAAIARRGGRGVVVDALDRLAVNELTHEVAPDVVVSQLTGMPDDPADLAEVVSDDVRIRREGFAAVLAAARSADVPRLVTQTSGFMLDGGGSPAPDDAPFRRDVPTENARYVEVWEEIERECAEAQDIDTVVLRYGFLYGPGTWYDADGALGRAARSGSFPVVGDGRGVWSFLHVDDAATATVAALSAPPATYNVVDDRPVACFEWVPAFVRASGGEPTYAPDGESAVQTLLDGARNDRARADLGLRPRPLPWMS